MKPRVLGARRKGMVLVALPFIAIIGLAPLANRINPIVLGLPFFLFWLLLWVLLTPVCVGFAYLLETREETLHE